MKCDELKAFDLVVAEEGYYEGIVKYRKSVYDKSEADKVIAHHEYKRCLAMADKCVETAKKYYYLICLDGGNNPKYDRFPNKMDFWGRWHKRWLELAEKFKPNKEAK